ncbi:hypothetical protein GQ55_8G192000 [Panicum hallii var. hallii]|uniref:DUF4228 domain-containing protein n=1 Tax=Panicum hallii var. hallii TaxID=1504633 RepID=A0A2T7CP32_9POAL|nr:hypothetical protein GQ55_8G192000 [Panicum hallii var. hallii]
MRQWKSLVPALHLHAPAPSCFPQPPSPSPCPSPPAEDQLPPPPEHQQQEGKVVRLVGCDGLVRAYPPPVTARELMQQHPRHLVCRADALLIGEKIPAVAPGEELQPGQAYFLLPAHLFRSVLSFVSLASSLLLLLSTTSSAAAAGKGAGRPFELHRTASGTLQIKFSDDFLVGGGGWGPDGAPRTRRGGSPPCCAGTRGSPRSTRSSSGTASPAAGLPSWRPSRRSSPPRPPGPGPAPPRRPPAARSAGGAARCRSSGASAAGAGGTRAAAGAPWRAPGS